jgi:hypothetical protein
VRIDRIAAGDVVKAAVKGRAVWGEVTEVKDGVVYFRPISPAAGWRHASAREIVGHWRKVGRRGLGPGDEPGVPDDPPPVPREQLSLKVWT